MFCAPFHRYLIFYCPLNLFYKCVAFLPVKLVLVALKEVVRTRKIAAGVHHAYHAYHHGFFIMIIVGYVKGARRVVEASSEVRRAYSAFVIRHRRSCISSPARFKSLK